jgi:hypothetical protein
VHSHDPKPNKEVSEQADENETEQISVLQHAISDTAVWLSQKNNEKQ